MAFAMEEGKAKFEFQSDWRQGTGVSRKESKIGL